MAVQPSLPPDPLSVAPDAQSAIAAARRALAAAGVEEAALESEVLVGHVLEVDRAALYARSQESLTAKQWESLQAFLARRQKREPLAYILGEREFYSLSFAVTPAVLVPRPETETLVEEALRWAGERGERDRPLTVADVGTGSGCIAVTLAVHLPKTVVIATDVSAGALEVARGNARHHGVEDRVRLLQGDLLDPLSTPVDLIVANLPYVAEDELAHLQPEVRDYEPRHALAGGPDGTRLLRRLLEQAPLGLRPGGAVILEMDPRQGSALQVEARRSFPEALVQVVSDLAGLDRVLVVTAPAP